MWSDFSYAEMNVFAAVGFMILHFVVLIIVLIVIISPIEYQVNKFTCLSSYSDYQPQYGFWTNCRINYDGKITPIDMVKNINIK